MTSFSSKKIGSLDDDVPTEEKFDNPAFEDIEGEISNDDITVKTNGQQPAVEDSQPYEKSYQVDPESPAPRKKELRVGDELEIEENKIVNVIITPVQKTGIFCKAHAALMENLFIALLALFYIGFMIAALIIDYQRAVALLVIFILVLFFQTYAFVRDHWGENIWEVWKPAYYAIARNMYWIKWVCIVILLGLLIAFIVVDVSKRPQQLVSLAGYVVFVFFLWMLGSKYPAKVRWRPVFWGLGIQVVLAALILRVPSVFEFFNWLGNFAQIFLDYVNAGSIFVFGEAYVDHYFAFKVLPIIIYFSSFISVMYYLGAMQWLIFKIAWLMQFSLGTSGTESMCAAGNIFVGQTESPLLIRPYIKDVTTSEMFAIMTAGFGTIAGSVLGAYLGFGIRAVYVITACVMAAPCALAIAKLMYPETKVSKFRKLEGLALDPPDQRNIVEAAFVGASSALPLVLNIAANLIAFISLLAALNGFLSWYGGLVNYPQLSFETICSYVFMPITYLMGIEWEDCFKCAELLGIKIFLNEFIAYEELARLIDNKDNGTYQRRDENGVNWISDKSEAIITYALCGFANVGSLGIMLGGLGTMCPERQKEMAKIVIRALFGGIFVSILNASVSGFFYLPQAPNCTSLYSFASWDGTVEPSSVYTCCSETVAAGNNTDFNYQRCCDFEWTEVDLAALDCF